MELFLVTNPTVNFLGVRHPALGVRKSERRMPNAQRRFYFNSVSTHAA
jgi:hypothetical protein